MIAYRTFRPPHVLSAAFEEFLREQAGRDLTALTGSFPTAWKAYPMGGLLRDMLLKQMLSVEVQPADLDLVIFGAGSIDEIRSKLGNANQSTNAFGGAKCQIHSDGLIFDLWRVEDHTNMAKAPKPHTIEQLLRHNLLDIDAILWEPATGCLHDCGCLQAITAGCIGLVGEEGISEKFAAAQVAHALAVAYKVNFPLSDDVRRFVAKASEQCPRADIERILERKLPHAAIQLKAFWNDILSGGTQACPAPTRTTITARP